MESGIHKRCVLKTVTSAIGASRSFMVQLYSMLAKYRSQVRFVNMNENVDRMYQLAVTAYNRPAVMPAQKKNNSESDLLSL